MFGVCRSVTNEGLIEVEGFGHFQHMYWDGELTEQEFILHIMLPKMKLEGIWTQKFKLQNKNNQRKYVLCARIKQVSIYISTTKICKVILWL